MSILNDSALSADQLREGTGAREAPECFDQACEFRTSAGQCVLPACRIAWPGPPDRLSMWAIGRLVARLAGAGPSLRELSRGIGLSWSRVYNAHATYMAHGWGWVDQLSATERPPTTKWVTGQILARCGRPSCGGTVATSPDGPRCLLCARPYMIVDVQDLDLLPARHAKGS